MTKVENAGLLNRRQLLKIVTLMLIFNHRFTDVLFGKMPGFEVFG